MNQLSIFDRIRSIGGVGILTEKDIPELNESERRVFDLMSDGGWCTADEIERAAGKNGQPAREGLRRMRELRKLPGVSIERQRASEGRFFVYRLVKSI